MRSQGSKPAAKTVPGDGGNSVQVNDTFLGHTMLSSQGYFNRDVTDAGGNGRYNNECADGICLVPVTGKFFQKT